MYFNWQKIIDGHWSQEARNGKHVNQRKKTSLTAMQLAWLGLDRIQTEIQGFIY